MLKIKTIEIQGFWGRGTVKCNFNKDVNVIIGRNGTGKTTLMNILHSALTCDFYGFLESDFEKISILLESDNASKKIEVIRESENIEPYSRETITYIIEGTNYKIPLLAWTDRRYPPSLRRRIEEEASEVRNALGELLNISSISVYRLRHDEDYVVRDKYGVRDSTPVDYRVGESLKELSDYVAELGAKEQLISKELQKNVLTSILYTEEDSLDNIDTRDFDRDEEERGLRQAYQQLGVRDADLSKKIKSHFNSIDLTIQKLKAQNEKVDLQPLEALRKTRKVIELSLKANEQVLETTKQTKLFLEKLKEFMPEKKFEIVSGKLIVENIFGQIKINKLSSGEKQLIILLIEALLQREQNYLLLADEPEISLHIEWQGKIIPAVRDLNPNGQVIVATHSPEVAAPYAERIFNMLEIFNE